MIATDLFRKTKAARLFVIPTFLFFLSQPGLAASATKMDFWASQRKGTNFFNQMERPERFAAAKKFGVEFIRLAPNKWLNGRPLSLEGDFLIGRPGKYAGINASDLTLLRKAFDEAHQSGLKVILTMLSIPGARWRQHNKGIEERRVWESFEEQDKAISFWRELAHGLKDHPALIGYNIRNEPSPELVEPKFSDWFTGDYLAWYRKIKGSPRDLNLFYQKAVAAIRKVDKETPIVLDSGFYATAWGFKILAPLDDQKVLYSFHLYEPYAFSSPHNKGKYHYPGKIPLGESESPAVLEWDRTQLEKYLQPIADWQKAHKVSANRILVGEVGVFRINGGAVQYLKDATGLLNERKWHWAFYSFREDTWAGMDYELGTRKPPWKYWEAIAKGLMPPETVYNPNPLSQVLKTALGAREK